jgi:hypothetical protein
MRHFRMTAYSFTFHDLWYPTYAMRKDNRTSVPPSNLGLGPTTEAEAAFNRGLAHSNNKEYDRTISE